MIIIDYASKKGSVTKGHTLQNTRQRKKPARNCAPCFFALFFYLVFDRFFARFSLVFSSFLASRGHPSKCSHFPLPIRIRSALEIDSANPQLLSFVKVVNVVFFFVLIVTIFRVFFSKSSTRARSFLDYQKVLTIDHNWVKSYCIVCIYIYYIKPGTKNFEVQIQRIICSQKDRVKFHLFILFIFWAKNWLGRLIIRQNLHGKRESNCFKKTLGRNMAKPILQTRGHIGFFGSSIILNRWKFPMIRFVFFFTINIALSLHFGFLMSARKQLFRKSKFPELFVFSSFSYSLTIECTCVFVYECVFTCMDGMARNHGHSEKN